MEIKKILVVACLAWSSVSMVNAQGFASFEVEGALTPVVIKNQQDKPGEIEAIVNDQVNITNLIPTYKLLGGCSIDGATPIGSDFSTVKKVIVSKKDGTSKEWNIAIRQLRPATVPTSISFSNGHPCAWTPQELGWAGIGLDTSKPTVARFGNKEVAFYLAFDAPAQTLAYELTVVGGAAFDGEFVVEVSKDSKKWVNLVAYNATKPIPTSGGCQHQLQADVRFARWIYLSRNKQNVNLNHIMVR